MELSRAMPTPYLAGEKIMKRFSGDYLSLPFDKASRAFWEMLFPLPYQQTLTCQRDRARSRSLRCRPASSARNPNLIRRRDPPFAYGLMQLVPATQARQLARKEGIKVSTTGIASPIPRSTFGSAPNTSEGQLNRWDGDWVKTLAAYNAGPSHVREWIEQFGYTDSAEFIENIPFSETRDYVQAVLRNGQVYRELYGKEKAILASDVSDPDSSALPPRRSRTLRWSAKRSWKSFASRERAKAGSERQPPPHRERPPP